MTSHKVLNDLDTEISERIKRMNVLLRERVSIRVEVEWKLYNCMLVFGKLDGAWQLFIQDHDERTALLSCDRLARVDAFSSGAIGELIATIELQVSIAIEQRHKAITIAIALDDEICKLPLLQGAS